MAFYGAEIDPQTALVAFGGITASSAGAANTVLTLSRNRLTIYGTNDTDKPVWLTYNGINLIYLPSTQQFALDLKKFDKSMHASRIIGTYHLGVAPTSGSLAVAAI